MLFCQCMSATSILTSPLPLHCEYQSPILIALQGLFRRPRVACSLLVVQKWNWIWARSAKSMGRRHSSCSLFSSVYTSKVDKWHKIADPSPAVHPHFVSVERGAFVAKLPCCPCMCMAFSLMYNLSMPFALFILNVHPSMYSRGCFCTTPYSLLCVCTCMTVLYTSGVSDRW